MSPDNGDCETSWLPSQNFDAEIVRIHSNADSLTLSSVPHDLIKSCAEPLAQILWAIDYIISHFLRPKKDVVKQIFQTPPQNHRHNCRTKLYLLSHTLSS